MAWVQDSYLRADEINTTESSDKRTSTRSASRSGQFGSVVNDYKGTHGALANYSVVGINASSANNAANNMVAACNRVIEKIDGITVNASTLDSAFKGEEMQNAFKSYVDKVKLYCEAVVSDVNAFADKIHEVGEKWKAGQSGFATGVINESANSNFSNGTTDKYKTTKAAAASGSGIPGERA